MGNACSCETGDGMTAPLADTTEQLVQPATTTERTTSNEGRSHCGISVSVAGAAHGTMVSDDRWLDRHCMLSYNVSATQLQVLSFSGIPLICSCSEKRTFGNSGRCSRGLPRCASCWRRAACRFGWISTMEWSWIYTIQWPSGSRGRPA